MISNLKLLPVPRFLDASQELLSTISQLDDTWWRFAKCQEIFHIVFLADNVMSTAPSSNGQDARFSTSKSEFDSPWGHHYLPQCLTGEGCCKKLPCILSEFRLKVIAGLTMKRSPRQPHLRCHLQSFLRYPQGLQMYVHP